MFGLVGKINKINKYEKFKIFKSSTPSADYRKIISNMEATVDSFIERAIAANKLKIAKNSFFKNREGQRTESCEVYCFHGRCL